MTASGSDGGLLFAADPRQSFDGQTIFWAPEVLPVVLAVGAILPPAISLRLPADLRSAGQLSHAPDGWHAVVRIGDTSHRLWLKEIPSAASPIAIELPLDADFHLRALAAHRLWRALGGRTPPASLDHLSPQRRQRLTLSLRAVDGRNEGNSYRAIAEVLFGRDRIPERGWKTHDIRNRTIRLVRTGLALIRGGYRALLHGRQRDG
jgi:hypothetical protein